MTQTAHLLTSHVSVSDAASLLGVSKATLRNWDRQGKLGALRHPVNGYRLYDINDLRRLQSQLGLFEEEFPTPTPLDLRSIKRLIGKLHDTLRDSDSQSNIIDRFDDLTKLLFAKVMADRGHAGQANPFDLPDSQLADAVRVFYALLADRFSEFIPRRFSELTCSSQAIVECAELLSIFDFSATAFDVKGLAYEEIIRNTFDKGDHQQFFTPPHIVDFVVSMCEPFIRGVVCDPASGTGGFLACVARRDLAYESLLSLEIDERLSWVSGINMLLHEGRSIKATCLPQGGTLGAGATPLFGTMDVIITNPPFGSDFSDPIALDQMELGAGRPSRRRGILFIERCHRLLKDGGTLAIIIDEGVLNLAHASDVRRFITSNFSVRAVVSLPESAFMPYATVNASILILKKASCSDSTLKTFFAKAETVGRKPNGDDDIKYDRDGKSFLNSDLPTILSAWHSHLANASLADSPNIFVADLQSNLAEAPDGHRIDFQFHHPARWQSKAMLERTTFPLRRLADLTSERRQLLVPSKDLSGTIIRYTGLANIEAFSGVAEQSPTPADSLKSGVKRYEPGDIVFAKMRPNLRKVAYMDFDEGGYVSPECTVFTVRRIRGVPVIDPLLLCVLLRSDFVFGQILHLIAGIGRPRIGTKELRDVLIPLPSTSDQHRMKDEFTAAQKHAMELLAQAENLNRQATMAIEASVGSLVSSFEGGK